MVDDDVSVSDVWSAADVGDAISPDGTLTQIEGGIIQAISWSLKEEISFAGGQNLTQNWDDYPILKFSEVPIANAKNKFGRSGLFEWAKSLVKLTLYSIVLGVFIATRMPDMVAVLQTEAHLVLMLLAELCITFLSIVVLISAAIGIIDAVWQHFEHIRKNRMSHKDIMDETKQSEGDPHMKQERRQRAMSIAQNQMMADVPTADVVIVNPTHYAVALKWSRAAGEAPVCVAKGVDEIAKAIREMAQSAGVPIHHDPPTARSLHATTNIGQQIEPDFYGAVAAAIQFAEAMRQRAKAMI